MQTELSRVIESVCKDKGIEKSAIVDAVEDAVLSAAQKLFKMEGKIKELEVHFNEEDGDIEIFEFKTVVDEVEDPETEVSVEEARELDPDAEEGDVIGVRISPEFTRIAIQNAKQRILQKIKEAEGKVIYEEFKNRRGELVSGIVRRIERRNVIVDLGRTEAILPPEHQVPKEYYKIKERLRAILIDIQETKRVPQLILSRAHPDFVRRLFEAEVPEIADGIVEIKGIAREPGARTKIAVASNDPDVDPVGACVGMKGSRVQNIIQELRGEKIDIVPWSPDPARFVCNALSPAQVNKVIIDENDNSMEVIVDDEQLSLAIGRKGQNVRLASRLTGWKLDIKTDSQIKREQSETVALLMTLPNVGEVTANILYGEGYRTLQDVAFTDTELFMKAAGISDPEEARKIQTAARIALKDQLERMTLEAEAEGEEAQTEEAETRPEGEVLAEFQAPRAPQPEGESPADVQAGEATPGQEAEAQEVRPGTEVEPAEAAPEAETRGVKPEGVEDHAASGTAETGDGESEERRAADHSLTVESAEASDSGEPAEGGGEDGGAPPQESGLKEGGA